MNFYLSIIFSYFFCFLCRVTIYMTLLLCKKTIESYQKQIRNIYLIFYAKNWERNIKRYVYILQGIMDSRIKSSQRPRAFSIITHSSIFSELSNSNQTTSFKQHTYTSIWTEIPFSETP